MKVPAALNTIPGQYAVIGIIGLVVVYYIGKQLASAGTKAAGAVTNAVGGALSGNNSLTQTQAGGQYQGEGILGTLAAGLNSITGGLSGSFDASVNSALGTSWPTGTNRTEVVTPNYVTDLSQTGVSDWAN